MTRAAMIASSFGAEFVSYGSPAVPISSFCHANFCPSAVRAGAVTRPFLASQGQAPGLLWVIATPNRVAWWHGDCAIAGVADGYRNRAEGYEGITRKTLMIVRPGMIAATVGMKDLHKVAFNAAGALKGALCGT